uniref:Uncharacterized protein n=1 Tax=Arundo donax TaxID=35708 RepID=A0A0A9GD64_ARUDO
MQECTSFCSIAITLILTSKPLLLFCSLHYQHFSVPGSRSLDVISLVL